MRPTKRIYCADSGKQKMLFPSQEKAENFIRYNSEDIYEENGVAPVRAYYCQACGGWHVTKKTDCDFYHKKEELEEAEKRMAFITSQFVLHYNRKNNARFIDLMTELEELHAFLSECGYGRSEALARAERCIKSFKQGVVKNTNKAIRKAYKGACIKLQSAYKQLILAATNGDKIKVTETVTEMQELVKEPEVAENYVTEDLKLIIDSMLNILIPENKTVLEKLWELKGVLFQERMGYDEIEDADNSIRRIEAAIQDMSFSADMQRAVNECIGNCRKKMERLRLKDSIKVADLNYAVELEQLRHDLIAAVSAMLEGDRPQAVKQLDYARSIFYRLQDSEKKDQLLQLYNSIMEQMPGE